MNLDSFHSVEDILHIAASNDKIGLSKLQILQIENSYNFLKEKVQNSESPIYGVNTGFGSLCNTSIGTDNLSQLQTNLLRSHACGMGEVVPQEIVRLMLLLKVKSLALGYSGVQLDTVNKLIDFYNSNITPVVYQLGSLGASGDLAPLAHLSLPLIGEGYVWKDGKICPAPLSSLVLGPKEGLALINGTQFMQAYGLKCLQMAEEILDRADLNAAMAIDAYLGRVEPFLPHSHTIRPHKGQQKSAATVLAYLQGSEFINITKDHVQDPYSFRCVPQVHGASWDVLEFAKQIFGIEINSVTDNPNVFIEEDLVLSAGNFHGQPLAMQLDFLAIALAEIGSIAERRIYRLMEGKRGLPAFVTVNPGLESGLMIAQYTAASIVSQNKQLCSPSSVDNIESSNGQEDHVSMGANAATKCLRVLSNVKRIQAIELLAICKAFEFRKDFKSSEIIEQELSTLRSILGELDGDQMWHNKLLVLENYLSQ